VTSASWRDGQTSLPPALLSRNPIRWLAIFGPGAVIASLTIGVGELVFSSRAGALFGYRLLWFFVLVLVLKWALVFASARHIVLTGAHPFQRWIDLPGPRGWLPIMFFLLAVPCFPIWVCFHAGTVGTLLSSLAGTEQALHGGAHFLWGIGTLVVVLVLCFVGGYAALERVQLAIVLLMLASIIVAVFFIHPNWLEFLKGLFVPQTLHYPAWLTLEAHPAIAARPVWLETTTYVGVIGGSSYDYLAYVSYLRDKRWGRAGSSIASPADLEPVAWNTGDSTRLWLRAPLIDCTLSFLAVLLFCAVFVICGAAALGPQHKVPDGSNLLSLQAEFVASVHPWLKHVYFAGAFLAVFGTLYGTIEVAPTVLREMAIALRPQQANAWQPRLRFWSVTWVGAIGLFILLWSLGCHFRSGTDKPPGLIAILTPANLFTGVLGCGIVCLLNVWMDRRFLPRGLRMNAPLFLISVVGGLFFVALGLKAYLDDRSRVVAFSILGATVVAGLAGAYLAQGIQKGR
jgi:Mn2+/Fe2+ NRAMP family transporter